MGMTTEGDYRFQDERVGMDRRFKDVDDGPTADPPSERARQNAEGKYIEPPTDRAGWNESEKRWEFPPTLTAVWNDATQQWDEPKGTWFFLPIIGWGLIVAPIAMYIVKALQWLIFSPSLDKVSEWRWFRWGGESGAFAKFQDAEYVIDLQAFFGDFALNLFLFDVNFGSNFVSDIIAGVIMCLVAAFFYRSFRKAFKRQIRYSGRVNVRTIRETSIGGVIGSTLVCFVGLGLWTALGLIGIFILLWIVMEDFGSNWVQGENGKLTFGDKKSRGFLVELTIGLGLFVTLSLSSFLTVLVFFGNGAALTYWVTGGGLYIGLYLLCALGSFLFNRYDFPKLLGMDD